MALSLHNVDVDVNCMYQGVIAFIQSTQAATFLAILPNFSFPPVYRHVVTSQCCVDSMFALIPSDAFFFFYNNDKFYALLFSAKASDSFLQDNPHPPLDM